MRLSDELEFIRALPEEGALVLTEDEIKRARIRHAIEDACGVDGAKRVVFAIASRDEQMKLVRAKAFEGNRCWPRITASMVEDARTAEVAARMAASMGRV